MCAKDINWCPYEIVKKNTCAQTRSCFYENAFVCTSDSIVCKSTYFHENHTQKKKLIPGGEKNLWH